jgi:glycine/D-amino acid oxidase-like deaminating enzyme
MEVDKRLPPYGPTAPNGLTIVPKIGGNVIVSHAGLADLQTSFEVNLTTEEAKMMLLADAVDLLPTLGEAKLAEQRGDFEGWSPPPRRIQPLLGLLPGWDNTYIAARFGTLGMMMSPGARRVMADLIMAGGRAPARFKNMLEVLNPAYQWPDGHSKVPQRQNRPRLSSYCGISRCGHHDRVRAS